MSSVAGVWRDLTSNSDLKPRRSAAIWTAPELCHDLIPHGATKS
jgi:hypothetical protein